MIGMTVCSGIGAPEYSAPWIDWRFQSEIEPFPCAALAARFPHATNLGDMSKFEEWPDANIDVLCGGTPCQSFSVAGLRKGLDDPRGNLMLTYLAIARRYRPKWLVWENVPGVLSSNGGRDFGTFLGGVGELGYGYAYRVLDAQYVRTQRFPWAVPQRRRRVFVVGYLGDWRRAAAVLFDTESLRRDPAPRRKAGQKPAPTISARTRRSVGAQDAANEHLITSHEAAPCLTARERKGALPEADLSAVVAHTLRGEGFDASEDGTGRGTPLVPCSFAQNQRGELRTSEVSAQLTTGGGKPGEGYPAVMQPYTLAQRGREGGPSIEYRNDGTSNAILTPNGGRAGMGVGAIASPWAVRRLTPRECERLMGFPDEWTRIPWRGKPPENCPDGPRYKALGNSWAVNCGEFVFERIKQVEAMQ